MQVDAALLARQPALGDPRRLARGGLEARVAAAAGAAARRSSPPGRDARGRSACRPTRVDLRARRHARRSGRRRRRRGAASPRRGRRARPEVRAARNACRSRSESSQRRTTSPPRPPSPPSGPPLGTCASRRNDREPLPPAPARTSKMGSIGEHVAPTVGRRRATRSPCSHEPRATRLPHHRRLDRHRRRHRPPRRRGRLPPRARRPLRGQARRRWRSEVGGLAVRCDVTEWEDQRGARAARRSTSTGASTSSSPTPASAPRAASTKGTPEEWKEMVLTNVYGVALTDPRDHAAAEGAPRATCCSPARWPAAARCRARSTRRPSTR